MPDYSNTRIQFRRGSSSQWAVANTILASGEPGIDQNSGVFKVGDGVTGWNSLSGINFSHHSEGGGGDVSTAQLNATNTNVSTVSGISVFSSGQSIVLQTSVGLLNTSSGVLNTSIGAIEVFNDISSGIAVFASGKALAGGGGDVSTAQFNIASGIGVFSSGQSVVLQTSVGLLETSSGVINTSVGLLEAASGALNTSVGLKLANTIEDLTPQLGGNLDMNSKDLTGTGDIILTGSGMFAYPDGQCGLIVTDTLGSGLHIGDCALDASSAYAGIKHSNHGTSDYMMISNGVTTFLSAVNNGAVILRGGGNDANSEIQIKKVGVGAVGIIFNEAGSDRDVRMEGASSDNLFRLDASTDRIGIKSAVPSHSLSVSGTLNANEIFISGATAVQTSPTLAKSSGSLNVSGINNLVFTDLAGHSGIAVKDTQTLYFIVNN